MTIAGRNPVRKFMQAHNGSLKRRKIWTEWMQWDEKEENPRQRSILRPSRSRNGGEAQDEAQGRVSIQLLDRAAGKRHSYILRDLPSQ